VSSPFLGEIRLFPYNFAPQGWAFCNGQQLAISQNSALFSLLGTTYGGNGTTTFNLPDLRGRVPVSSGQGPGLSPYSLGQNVGLESVTLTTGQMPTHAHTVEASAVKAKLKTPAGAVPGHTKADDYDAAPDGATTMNAGMIAPAGGSQPHSNIQPLLVMNFCIAMQGIFPSRN
jgi:microcystin-dependent protein